MSVVPHRHNVELKLKFSCLFRKISTTIENSNSHQVRQHYRMCNYAKIQLKKKSFDNCLIFQ